MREPNPKQGTLFSKKAVSPGFKKAMELREKLRPVEPPIQPKQFPKKALGYYRRSR